MKRNLRRLCVILPATFLIALGAARMVRDYRNSGVFQPLFSDRKLQSNQVLFPDDATASGLDEANRSDESFWQEDAQGEQNAPAAGTNPGYLFSQDQVPSQTTGLVTGTGQPGSGGAVDGVYGITDRREDADLVISGSTDSSNDRAPSRRDDNKSNGSSGSGSSDRPSNGSSGSGDNGGSTPTPSPTPSGDYGTSSQDPASDKTAPPNTPEFPNKDYTESVLPSIGGDLDDASIVIAKPSINASNFLYVGQGIDKKIIYNALDTYIIGNDGMRYLWGESALDTYVRIDAVSFDGGETWVESFPVIIPEDAANGIMTIRVSYRLSASGEWTERLVQYELETNRVFILKEPLADGTTTIDPEIIMNADTDSQHIKPGTFLNLFHYQWDYLVNQGLYLTSLFPGWTENGTLVPWFYSPSNGRHVLEPAASVPLDPAYEVSLHFYWMTDNYTVDPFLGANLCYLQTLNGYTPGSNVRSSGVYMQANRLTVPNYIQAIDIDSSNQLETKELIIPASVLYINTVSETLRVSQSYTVDAGNPMYRSERGILLNRQGTAMIGIPLQMTSITAAASVQQITLPAGNHVRTITLQAGSLEQLPQINYANISDGCTIVVADDLFEAFLLENRATFAKYHVYVAASSDPQTAYTVSQNAIISRDGTVKRVLAASGDSVYLPKEATVLLPGALDDLGDDVTTLVLPRSGVVSLEGALEQSSIRLVLCYTQEQYTTARASAPEDVDVVLCGTSQEGYGYYLKTAPDGTQTATILSAPETVQEFTGDVTGPDGKLTVSAIGANAFAGCEQLKWVTLPESVKEIGAGAFEGCSILEGVLIDSKDSISIGANAFADCPSLRFIASNALSCDMDPSYDLTLSDPYSDNYGYLFAPTGCTGYPGWLNFTPESGVAAYRVDVLGDNSRILCAIDTEGTSWMALRSGKTMDAETIIPEDIIELFNYSLANTTGADGGSYHVTLPSSLIALDTGAFYHANIGPSVDVPALLVLGVDVFYGCQELETVTFENLNGERDALQAGIFSGCNKLTDITFKNDTPPQISVNVGTPFRFNYNWTQDEEAQNITLHVPENSEKSYVKQWRYAMTGYVQTFWASAYDNLYNAIAGEYFFDYYPDDVPEEVILAELEARLLTGENYLRRILGMDEVTEPTELYHIKTDSFGFVTLTKTMPGLEYAYLYDVDIGLPSDWSLNYIASGAFSRSTNLKWVALPDKLLGISSGVFAGVIATQENPLEIVCWSQTPPELMLDTQGTPFSFGLDKSCIRITIAAGWDGDGIAEAYLRKWLFPMAGYDSMAGMRGAYSAAYPDESTEEIDARIMQALLIAENKLRRMFDCFEEIDSVDDMIGLTEPDDSTDTGTDPDWPDWPDWPDLDPFAAQESDASPEESNPSGSSSNPESIGGTEVTAASQNTVSGLLSGEEGDTYDY